MSLLLPEKYPWKDRLNAEGVSCYSDFALENRIRVAILNLMPEAETYELSLLIRLGKACQILNSVQEREFVVEPLFIRSEIHTYTSSNPLHLRQFYQSFEMLITKQIPDRMIVTGAPVELLPFEKIRYWDELKEILKFSRREISATMGICWGAIALGKLLGIETQVFEKKICGLYPTEIIAQNHSLFWEIENGFLTPQSRYAGLNEESLSEHLQDKTVTVLGRNNDAGSFLCETSDKRFLMHAGHPEYTVERILFEYHRDQKNGKKNIPVNFNVVNPVENWYNDNNHLFCNWLKPL